MNAREDAFSLRLGSQINRARRERGWTQARLAEELGIDARSLQRIESGRTAPSLQRLREIADVLGVSCGALIDGAAPSKRRANSASAARDQGRDDDSASLLRVWSRVPSQRRRLALAMLRLLATEPSE
jgi:transcriptional regulator with XRE-family HTH domain